MCDHPIPCCIYADVTSMNRIGCNFASLPLTVKLCLKLSKRGKMRRSACGDSRLDA